MSNTDPFVATITNFGHWELTLEATSHSIIDTLGFSPCLLDSVITVRLMSSRMVK